MNNAVKNISDIKCSMHKEICECLTNVYSNKNADYGDSFSSLRKEFPEAILVRIGDKYNRLKTLYRKKDIPVTNESISDTLLDLANYCIMELIEIQLQESSCNEVVG